MDQVYEALTGATAAAIGPVLTFDSPRSFYVTLQVNITGSPSGISYAVEGSLDGVNFISAFYDNVTANPVSLLTGAGQSQLLTALRFNLRSLTGGTSPTVTALLAIKDVDG
jgi:hypothetical protein